ncbi:MAG TPA: DUF1549 and DUF1553 domain-containing protein [Gemmataceae bacterium]|nr:DUF1549 and DUF1553 domain-containing protein [Gemmataceae bacterium]
MHAFCITRFGSSLVLAALLAAPVCAGVKLPGGETVEKVDFERHVMGVFGRMGCNSGSCHGSFQGKGGFRLSLFGYDPAMDYLALSRDIEGRRLNLADPDNSLLLLKASGRVPHEGQTRFSRETWAYQLLSTWIKQGARWDKGSGTVKQIIISPPEYAFRKPGERGQLQVKATFTDGTTEPITSLCDFRTNDEAIVEVTPQGQVKAVRPGDTAVIVSYRGNVLPVRVLVPFESKSGAVYPKVAEVNFIDREVFAKLRRLNIVPSGLSSDTEFLRRVTIDTIGTLPTPQEVRDFLADKHPDKRTRKIDELLAHPMHAALWATKFCDITGNNTDALENPQQRKAHLSQMWHDWFRKRLADNMPYDEIVRGVLCASSREGHSPEEYVKQTKETEKIGPEFNTAYANRASLDLFWRRQQRVPIEQWGEKTAAAFLGVRLECAQCHKHPFDRWTQADYRSYANVFAQVAFDISPESQKLFRTENAARKTKKGDKKTPQLAPLREVYVRTNGKASNPLTDPETKKPLPAKALGGPVIAYENGKDPRATLFDWMHAPENPFFARSLVNRVWGHYFGTGIVHPVDDFSLANPPSNAKLLDALAKDFLTGKYNLRALERKILLSRTYQLASAPNETNRLDRTNYSHSYVRPMMAEVMVDVLNAALGATENFGAELPAGSRAIEVGASRLQNGSLNYAFRIFGRPPRTTACDCERAMEPGLPQKLYLMADPSIQQKMQAPQGRIRKLLAAQKDDNRVLDELFLATQSRLPTPRERERFADYRTHKGDRQAAFLDTMWALINTNEFVFNH